MTRIHGPVLGLPELDAPHADMLTRADDLAAAARSRQARKAILTLDGLLEATALHFAYEEEWMDRTAFPDRVAHRTAHDLFLQDLHTSGQELRASGDHPAGPRLGLQEASALAALPHGAERPAAGPPPGAGSAQAGRPARSCTGADYLRAGLGGCTNRSKKSPLFQAGRSRVSATRSATRNWSRAKRAVSSHSQDASHSSLGEW